MVEWTVQSAYPNNGIRRIHLVRDAGAQREDLFLNVTPQTAPEAFNEGDVWGVTLTLISRRGSNGHRQ
jgi:hypothetical protein